MLKRTYLVLTVLLMGLTLVFGCSDGKIEEIEKTQKEILAKVNNIEENQKEILKLFKPRRATVDYNKVQNIPAGDSPVRGNKEAPVTIVEFSDFQCPYCSRVQSILEEVLKAYPKEARLIFKDFPLSFHKHAKSAARAAHAAGEQGKYWEMHDLIFKNYNKLAESKFEEFADELKLDKEKFTADFRSNKYDKRIQDAVNLGKKIGVSGTPTLFINGKRMKGRSFDDFKTAIESYVK